MQLDVAGSSRGPLRSIDTQIPNLPERARVVLDCLVVVVAQDEGQSEAMRLDRRRHELEEEVRELAGVEAVHQSLCSQSVGMRPELRRGEGYDLL